MGYGCLKELILFLWWWIASPNMPTSSAYVTPLEPCLWLRLSPRRWCVYMGFPHLLSLITRVFLSIFWKELFRLHGTSLKRSTAYHPQTDGQTEVVNKKLETYLRCFASGQPRSWARWLPWAEFSYNSTPHSSTKMSPFKVVCGRDPPAIIRVQQGQTADGSGFLRGDTLGERCDVG